MKRAVEVFLSPRETGGGLLEFPEEGSHSAKLRSVKQGPGVPGSEIMGTLFC
jgi:hypothetical protein